MRITLWIAAVLTGAGFLASAPTPAQSPMLQDQCSGTGGIKPDQALQACILLEKGGSVAGAQLALVLFKEGHWYLETGRNASAATAYTRSIALDPTNADAYAERGAAYGRDYHYQPALADFTQYLKMRPKDAAIYQKRAFVYGALGQDDLAFADFTTILALDPKDSSAYLLRGYLYLQRGEYDRAIADDSAAIAVDPKAYDTYMGRGCAYYEAGDFQHAGEDLTRAVRSGQTDAYPVLWLHLARQRLGTDDAAELADNAAKVQSQRWPAPVVELYLGHLTPVQTFAAATTPEDTCEAHFYIGEWEILQKNLPAAMTDISTAAKTCPRSFTEYSGARAELRRLTVL